MTIAIEGEGELHSGKDDAIKHDEEGVEVLRRNEGPWGVAYRQ
jgi:hypothetical protein